MAEIFQPPQIPPTFIGGRQPYAPPIRVTASIDPPKPDADTDVNLAVVLQAWRPETWPYAFQGGQQPYQLHNLTPPSGTNALPVYVPFVNGWLPGVIASWQPPDPQPTLPVKLPIVGQSRDPPPPNADTLVNLGVLNSWQPETWPYAFVGGSQPYANPVKVIQGAPPVNEPPSSGLTIVNVIRDYRPFLPGKMNPALMGTAAVVVVQPPFSQSWLSAVLQAWQPPDPFPQQRTLRQIVSVDNPPPDADTDINFNAILSTWQPPDPWPIQRRPTQIVSVDNPPAYTDDLADMYQIVGAWQPPDPLPVQPRYNVVQSGPVVVTYVPYNRSWLSAVIASWQQPDQLAAQPKYQQQVSVDNPPRYSIRDQVGIVQAWQPVDPSPQQPRFAVVQPGVVVTYVPYNRGWLSGVIASWQPPDPQPLQSRYRQIVSVDNPPFSTRRASPEITQQWQPDPWSYTLLGPAGGLQPYAPRLLNPFYTAVPVNDPPFSHRARSPIMPALLYTWQPPDPQPVQRGPLPAIVLAVRVDNPPFILYGSNNWVIDVLASWQPPDPQPRQRPITLPIVGQSRDQPPAITNMRLNMLGVINTWQPPDPFPTQPIYRQRVSVDNPPRYSTRDQMGRVQSWQPPDPFATQPRYNVVPPTVVVVYVPFTRPWLSGVMASWQPPDPAPVQPRHRQILSVDNPPGFVNDYLPDPLPYVAPLQRRTTFVPGSSVDNPPRYTRTSVITGQIISTWWQPPDPQPWQKPATIRVSVDQPRPRQMAWFATVLQQWQPPDPQPVTAKRNLPASVTAVPVDNPPFDMRWRVQRSIVQAWQPYDQPPSIFAFYRHYSTARFIPFTQATIIKHPLLRGTLTTTTLVGIDSAPKLRSTDAVPNLDGDP